MVAGAAILAVYIVLQNFRKAGWLWGAVVTAAQSLILVALGPTFAAMLALFVFRGLTKTGVVAASRPIPRLRSRIFSIQQIRLIDCAGFPACSIRAGQ